MAAGNVIFYQHAVEDMMRGALDLQSITLVLSAISQGYTPSPQSHSSYTNDISAYVVTAAGYTDRLLSSQAVSRTTNSHVAVDAADVTLSATGTIKAKYIVCRAQNTGRPVFYFDADQATTTGIEATQIVVQWNALGIARINNPA